MRIKKLSDYKCIVFDCDGVLLDSNRIKTDAFRLVALPYGRDAADALVKFHIENGGVSRFRKFEFFVQEILGLTPDPSRVDSLIKEYAEVVFSKLIGCAVADGLGDLKAQTPSATWMIVSGGAEEELRTVFAERGLDRYFDGGIFGSPSTKDDILSRRISIGELPRPALFIGDSRYDHEAASRAGLDFIFASAWTEFHGWKEYCERHEIATVPAVLDLLGQS